MTIEATTIEMVAEGQATVTITLGSLEGEHVLIRLRVPLAGGNQSLSAIQATALAHARELIGEELSDCLERARLQFSQLPQRL